MGNENELERVATQAAARIAGLAGENPLRLACRDSRSLPGYARSAYLVAEAVMGGRLHVFFVLRPGVAMSAERIAKQMEALSPPHALPVLVTRHMTRRMAERLADAGASFVVPGRHVHVQGIGSHMGTRFDPPRPEESHPKPIGAMGAYAQASVLLQILRGDPEPMTPMDYARTFFIRQTTALKAADELEEAGLCRRTRDGRPRPVEFLMSGQELFDAALPRLSSPLSNVGYLAGRLPDRLKPSSGEWALSRRSMLSEPALPSIAIHRSLQLVFFAARAGMEISNAEDADARIERWRYPPDVLSQDGMADPLSLYLMFGNHPDERVAIAAEEMLDDYWRERGLRSGDRPAAR